MPIEGLWGESRADSVDGVVDGHERSAVGSLVNCLQADFDGARTFGERVAASCYQAGNHYGIRMSGGLLSGDAEAGKDGVAACLLPVVDSSGTCDICVPHP